MIPSKSKRLLHKGSIAGLRAFMLGSKFLFTIFLAKELTLRDFGLWILLVGIVSYGVFVVGGEIYTISLRRYFQNEQKSKLKLYPFGKKIQYFIYIYIVLLIAGFLLSNFEYYYNISLIYIVIIIILEHITTEFQRFSLYSNHQIISNINLLLKSSLWMLVSFFYYLISGQITLDLIINFWILGCLLDLIFCIYFYMGVIKLKWKLFFRLISLRIAITSFIHIRPFLILAISIKSSQIFDRLIIQHYSGTKNLAVYGYYLNYINGAQSICDAIILGLFLPLVVGIKIIDDKAIKLMNKFIVYIYSFWIIYVIVGGVTITFINKYVANDSYSSGYKIFFLLCAAQCIFNVGCIYQYMLYGMKKDRELATGGLIFIGSFLFLLYLLVPFYGVYGASTALIISSSLFMLNRRKQLLFYRVSSD